MNRRQFSAGFLASWVLLTWADAIAATRVDGLTLVAAARAQIGVTVRYDPAYREIAFPFGDVPRDRGVCTDVIVRAFRDAYRVDLQSLVHADIKGHWGAYQHQRRWSQSRPDANIDHRRVPHLMTYFSRHARSIALRGVAQDFLPGDIVAWDLGGAVLHIGFVSDRRSADQRPLVIHNIGRGTVEEDLLHRYQIIGHYRVASLADQPLV